MSTARIDKTTTEYPCGHPIGPRGPRTHRTLGGLLFEFTPSPDEYLECLYADEDDNDCGQTWPLLEVSDEHYTVEVLA